MEWMEAGTRVRVWNSDVVGTVVECEEMIDTLPCGCCSEIVDYRITFKRDDTGELDWERSEDLNKV